MDPAAPSAGRVIGLDPLTLTLPFLKMSVGFCLYYYYFLITTFSLEIHLDLFSLHWVVELRGIVDGFLFCVVFLIKLSMCLASSVLFAHSWGIWI